MKKCTKCNKEKELSNFSKTGTNKNGSTRYNSWCNSCRTVQNRERTGAKEKPKPIVTDDSKECLECNKLLKLDEFRDSARGRKGKSSYCKPCEDTRKKEKYYSKEKAREATKRYRERNKERWRAIHRIHQFNRKALIKATCDGSVTDEFLKLLLDKEICIYCNEKIPASSRTIEHIQELSQGGTHTSDNLDMACLSCNSSRPNKYKGKNNDDKSNNHS